MERNIFSALAKYSSAKDENYLTEAFVFILHSLRETDEPIFQDILSRLCIKNNEYSFSINEKISIKTQGSTEQGRPDIIISAPNKLIYVEVKHDSGLGYKQIERYKTALESSDSTIKKVILLTRFSVEFAEHQAKPYKHVRWFEVYKWFSSIQPTNLINVYLIKEFLKFLEEKRMSVKKISWEYMNGVPALKNLMDMLEVAIEAASLTIGKRSAGWGWMGYYINGGNFFCGIYYEDPLVLKFDVYKENKTIKAYELRFEDIYFFSLNEDKQLAEIIKFLTSCNKEAKTFI